MRKAMVQKNAEDARQQYRFWIDLAQCGGGIMLLVAVVGCDRNTSRGVESALQVPTVFRSC